MLLHLLQNERGHYPSAEKPVGAGLGGDAAMQQTVGGAYKVSAAGHEIISPAHVRLRDISLLWKEL